MKSVSKWIILIILLAAPAFLFAGSKSSDHTLAEQIEQAVAGVAPNTVIIVVDEATSTAYLRGSVSSHDEVDRITNLVRSIDGVRVIGSTLVVVEPSPFDEIETTQTVEVEPPLDSTFEETPTEFRAVINTDASLQAAVVDALKSEGILGQSKIKVETDGGVVTLTGTALSESHADRIVALAMAVPGVKALDGLITLRDQKRVYQVKPSFDRDKEGREAGKGLSRVPEAREGEVDVDVDIQTDDNDDR